VTPLKPQNGYALTQRREKMTFADDGPQELAGSKNNDLKQKKPISPTKKVGLYVRIDAISLAKLSEQAGQAGMTKAVWLEAAIITNATKIITKDRPGLRSLLYQVNAAGNNINQIAKTTNILQKSGDISPEAFKDAIEKLEEVTAVLQEAIRHAG